MKKVLVLGAGTAGTMMVNKLRPLLPEDDWSITIVDQEETHYYQPGFLFIPFGVYGPKDVVKPRRDYVPAGVELIVSPIDLIEPDNKRVMLEGGRALDYDLLIIATGTTPRPKENEGMTGSGWRKNIFDFYTYDGTQALARFLRHWQGGRMVLNVSEMPIKCPVAPLEFLMLADWFFHTKGIRDKVEIEYVTPLEGAFTKPRASAMLGDILQRKNVKVTTEFNLGRVEPENNKIVSFDAVARDTVGIREAGRRTADQPEGSDLREYRNPDRANRPERHSDFEARTDAVIGGAEIGVAPVDHECAFARWVASAGATRIRINRTRGASFFHRRQLSLEVDVFCAVLNRGFDVEQHSAGGRYTERNPQPGVPRRILEFRVEPTPLPLEVEG